MRVFRSLFLGAAVALLAGWAHADTIGGGDPDIEILGAEGSTPIFGTTFMFTSPTGTSPAGSPCVLGEISVDDCIFTNASEVNWFTLTFDISPGGQSGPFNCSFSRALFDGCEFNRDGTQVTFFVREREPDENTRVLNGDRDEAMGIRQGADFQVRVTGWKAGTGFAGTANIPEPGTITLFLSGLGAFAARRRFRRSA